MSKVGGTLHRTCAVFPDRMVTLSLPTLLVVMLQPGGSLAYIKLTMASTCSPTPRTLRRRPIAIACASVIDAWLLSISCRRLAPSMGWGRGSWLMRKGTCMVRLGLSLPGRLTVSSAHPLYGIDCLFTPHRFKPSPGSLSSSNRLIGYLGINASFQDLSMMLVNQIQTALQTLLRTAGAAGCPNSPRNR